MRFKKFINYLFGKQIVYEPEPELAVILDITDATPIKKTEE